MEEKKLTEKESLEVITTMIARTKERYLGNGSILMMWGYLIAAVTTLVWVMLALTHNGRWNWLWFAIPLAGWPAMLLMSRRQTEKGYAVTFYDKVTSRIWIIAGVSELVVAIACLCMQHIAGVNCWSAMLTYTLIAVPIAEIAQGCLIRENSLTIGGAGGLAVGIITLCCVTGGIVLGASWYMPLFIFAFVAMMVIPGHILNIKSNRR